MSKSRCDLPLISIGALIAINQNNLLQATVCLEQLILNLPEKKLIEELDSLFLLVNNKSKFFSAIPTKYQAKLLIAAIKMKSQNIVELLLNEKLLAAMISDEFSAMTAMLFKYQLHHLAEFSIQIRKNYASKSIENELATLILLLQIENFSEKYTAIRSLHQLGISPMKKFVKNNQTYTLALTAMSSADKKLISFYLAPEFLTTYSDKEISLLFIELIKENHYLLAENLLKEKHIAIMSHIKQAELDLLILTIASSEMRNEVESMQNLIYFFLQNGANPITHLRLNHLSAFPIYGPIYEIFTKDNLNQYLPEDLIFIIKDCIKTPQYSNKKNILQLILGVKKELLSKYFSDHPEAVDNLLYLTMKLKDDTIFTELLSMGANPIHMIRNNKSSLILALNHQYHFAIKNILENKIENIPADHLAIAFKVSLEKKWSDLASLIASPRNPLRKETLAWLMRPQATEFLNLILQEENPNQELLLQLCQSPDIEVDKKEGPSLIQYALKTHSAEMIKILLTHQFHKLSPQKVNDAISDLLEQNDNHFKDIIYLKCLEQLKISHHEKREMATKIFLKCIQKAKNIPEVLMIATFIKSNPTHFTYFNTFLSTELKKIIESAILKINEITKSERELVFSRQQFSELLQFLDNSPGFRMFYHPKEDFMCLAKNKIHLQDSMVLTPQLAG